MIFGVGIDLVLVPRIEKALARFGDRFAKRILTAGEFERYLRSRQKTNFLAKHFAAKEATVKALGTGFRDGVSWRHVEVRHNQRGRPYLECSGRVRELFEQWQIGNSHISLCDEVGYATAIVTLEYRDQGGT